MTTYAKIFRKTALASAIASSFISSLAIADGRVSGRVSDQNSQIYFEGAVVRINELNRETSTAGDGRFFLNGIPAGTYDLQVDYLGAEPVSLSITVNDDETTRQDIKIGEHVAAIENVIVRGQAASANRALNQMRASDHLVSIVTADDVGQLPDENVSEALQRMPGVFIERDQGEGRYVGVRGIDSNLNVSSINGQKLSSPEADRRSVALDVIPAELIESLSVSKTLTPDMDGDAIGGTINIKSLTAFDRDGLFYKASLNGNYSQLESDNGYKFSGAVTNVFNLESGDLGLALSYSNQERNFGSENIEADGGWEEEFEDDEGNTFIAHEEMEARDYQVTREREGLALNLDFRPGEETLYYSRFLYSQFGDQEYRNRMEYKLDEGDYPVGSVSGSSLVADNTELERSLKDRYEEQEITSLLLGFETHLDGWQLEGNLAYSEASENEPNRFDSSFVYEGAASAGYSALGKPPRLTQSADALEPGNYEFGELVIENNLSEDENFSASFDGRYDLKLGNNPGFIKFGLTLRQREKTNDANASAYEGDFMETFSWQDFIGSDLDYSLANIGPAISSSALRRFFNENESDLDIHEIDTAIANAGDYLIEEDVTAGYLMAQTDINDWRLTYGVRVEQTDVSAQGNNIIAFENADTDDEGVDISENTFETDYTNILPSINARYNWRDRSVVRASWYASIGRPSFGDLRPTHEDVELVIEDGEGEFVVESAGNPELEPFEADNFDISYEFYPGGIGAISAGLFHKRIDNFIFVADIADTVDINRYFDLSGVTIDEIVVDEFIIPLNGGSAEITGIELAWTRAFENGLILQTNATFSDSSADYPGREDEDLPLANQSDSIFNFIVGYEGGGLSLRLSTAYQSKRLLELSDTFNDLYEDAHTQFDFSARYDVNENWQAFFTGKNLSDEAFYSYHGQKQRIGQYEEYGRAFELGVTFKNQ